jgi:alpha-L-arabinofuranosidase
VKLDIKTGDVRRLEPLRFAVSVEGIERVDVDQISLMPDDAIGTLDHSTSRSRMRASR